MAVNRCDTILCQGYAISAHTLTFRQTALPEMQTAEQKEMT